MKTDVPVFAEASKILDKLSATEPIYVVVTRPGVRHAMSSMSVAKGIRIKFHEVTLSDGKVELRAYRV